MKICKLLKNSPPPQLEPPPSKPHESLEQLEPKAENEIEEVGARLEEMASLHGHVALEEAAKKVVEGVSHVLDYLGVVASLHPIAGIVVTALTHVVALERQRHENNAHIVVVHATMVKTVYHVRFLTRIQHKFEEDVEEKLKVIFKHMAETINEFGGFINTYHACWQKTYKVLFSHIHKRKLEHYGDRFKQHREDLDEMRKTMTQMQLATVVDNTEKILRRLQIDDPDVEEAEEFVRRNGGPDAVRASPELVEKVAGILKEKATPSMKQTLLQGFDVQLEKHNARYMKMLQGVQDTIVSQVTNAQTAIIERLNKGPHDLIEDVDVRKIWEDNRWKSSVKCRIFVEGLHEYYQQMFHKYSSESRVPHHDAWTLDFFSRVMYHSAIGDVVDDDGSGYLSASEVNDFISEQRGLALRWTIPQWFAFWACGWYNNNAWYYRRIQHLVKQAEECLKSAAAGQDHPSWDEVQIIVVSLKRLVLVADVEDFSGIVKVPHQLHHLQEQYRIYDEERITANLSSFGQHIVDRPSLNAVVGDSRIELHMMPLLYILMERLHDTVGTVVKSQRFKDSSLIAIEELATSCIAVFSAFEDRMHDLVRGWRFESKDINAQVDRYADGLFRKCYRQAHVYEQAYHDLRKAIFGDGHPLPRHLRPFESSQHRRQTSSEDLAHDVTMLSNRVVALESRLPAPADAEKPKPLSRTPSRSTIADGESVTSSSATARTDEENQDGVAKLDAQTPLGSETLAAVMERLKPMLEKVIKAALDERSPTRETLITQEGGSDPPPVSSPSPPPVPPTTMAHTDIKSSGQGEGQIVSITVPMPWLYAALALLWTLAVGYVSRR